MGFCVFREIGRKNGDILGRRSLDILELEREMEIRFSFLVGKRK